MKGRKNILFTFDYELFLGKRSGTVDNSLIYPTQKIIEALNPYNARGIFFIDTTYLTRLKEQNTPDTNSDYRKISEQIQNLIGMGHYVFPHIHAHWINAKHDSAANQWDLSDLSNYRFHSLSLQEKERLFDTSMKLLNEIIESVDPLYQINAYRAGGWSIQPFDDYLPFFVKHGLKNDFSVLPGFKCFSKAQHFDFTGAPLKPIYKFSQDVLKEDQSGEMTEYSISKIAVSKLDSLLNRVILKVQPRRNRSFGNGISVEYACDNEQIEPEYEMASLDTLTFVKLPLYYEYLSGNNYLQFISHPKMMSLSSLSNLNKFLKWVFSHYEVETDFKKMSF